MKKTIFKYTLYGVLFGLCFPIGALLFERFILGHAYSIIAIHQHNKLMYMIDTAPLFLGIFAAIGGYFRAQADELIVGLQKQSAERTIALKESNAVKAQLRQIMDDVQAITPYLQDNVHKLDHSLIKIMERLDQTTLQASQGIENISTTLTGLAENTSSSGLLLDRSLSSLKAYEEKLAYYHQRMGHIEENIDSSNERLQLLLDKSNQIVSALTFLQEMATNTQLIALNASIEAAKLGGESNSFKVIATEINKLSAASSQSISDIGPLLTDIKKEIEAISHDFKDTNQNLLEGANIITAFTPLIDDLTQDIQHLKSSIETTTENLHAQSQDVHQISYQTEAFALLRHDVQSEIYESKEPMENSIQIIEEILSKLEA